MRPARCGGEPGAPWLRARRKNTISKLPKKTRTALGKQGAKIAKQKRRKPGLAPESLAPALALDTGHGKPEPAHRLAAAVQRQDMGCCSPAANRISRWNRFGTSGRPSGRAPGPAAEGIRGSRRGRAISFYSPGTAGTCKVRRSGSSRRILAHPDLCCILGYRSLCFGDVDAQV
jgi:hypothetical protein